MMHDAVLARKRRTKHAPAEGDSLWGRFLANVSSSRKRPHLRAASILPVSVVLGLAGACTNANLYHVTDVPSQPNKVTFTGRVCTDNPTERRFPLRVVFMVDASPLMPDGFNGAQVSELLERRSAAIRDTVALLRAADTGFALVRYGGLALASPNGTFTTNSVEMDEAAGALAVPVPCTQDGCRRTSAALSLASSLVSGDVLSSAKGPRARTSYVIVHVQTGPTDDLILNQQTNAACDATCVLAGRVASLRQSVLTSGAASFTYHTLDVSVLSDDATERATTGALLTALSFAGAGEYNQICRRLEDGTLRPPNCGPSSLNLLGLDIESARNVFVKKTLIVSNMNAIHTEDGVIADSDQDGLSDDEERIYGTDPTRRDTDGDGIGDKIEMLLSTVGLDPLVASDPPQCATIPNRAADTDGDGLTDCEEALLRLDPTLFDTDADGYPDLIEFLGGTNFLENDILVDSDFDGVPNGTELRIHSDPRSADPRVRAEFPYLYRENDLGIREILFASQPRAITGVTVANIGPSTSLGNGTLVWLYDPPVIAWKDPNSTVVGDAVRVADDGVYRLQTGCENADDEDCVSRYIDVELTRAILPPYPIDEIIRVQSAERQCIDFRVRNVTLIETLAADGRPRGNNDIRIYFGQVPQNRPESFGIFRVAQYQYRYLAPDKKDPNVADQNVDSFRFVLFGD
jgi:hypothetical protein